jgi:ubiquinone/menaquinone biosynthesis C-methylase UbiE
MDEDQDHERRFHGGPERLRSPERLAMMEPARVAVLSEEGLAVREMLDIGTGTGVFAEAFIERGISATGVDVNAELLGLARELVPAGRFVEAPAERLPFPDCSFDLAFFGLVLHETDDPLAALKEARRVARGRVSILEWVYRDESQGPPLAHRMKPETIEALAASAGFSKVGHLRLERLELYRLDA